MDWIGNGSLDLISLSAWEARFQRPEGIETPNGSYDAKHSSVLKQIKPLSLQKSAVHTGKNFDQKL